tara:strand:+ start:115 stop:756 length:642 start_codon:yes stop_codon:yes gene_type:complete
MLKQKYFIDSHKGATPLFVIALIWYFNQWNNVYALLYLALHGTYGILWMTKSQIFPDKQWEQKTSIWYGLFIWFGLSLYWISPYIITTNRHFLPIDVTQNSIYIGLCVMIYIYGIFLHFTSDMQKHMALKLNPGKLITDGMFSRIRNTNYLGELFIYLGFTLLSRDWLPVLALILFIFSIWVPNMIKKDKSLSRYQEFKEYKNRTSKMFPFLF